MVFNLTSSSDKPEPGIAPLSWDHNMADQNDVDLDSIIDRLLEVRGSRPGKQVQLLEAEIRHLCQKAREIFISQPILLELEAPIKVCASVVRLSDFRLACATALIRYFVCRRSVVIFMASITTFSAFLSTEGSHPKQITFSLGTTLIEANNPLKLSACFSRTRLSTPRISLSCVGTMSAHQ